MQKIVSVFMVMSVGLCFAAQELGNFLEPDEKENVEQETNYQGSRAQDSVDSDIFGIQRLVLDGLTASCDGRYVAGVVREEGEGEIQVWDIEKREQIRTLKKEVVGEGVMFSPIANGLAFVERIAEKCVIQLWDIETEDAQPYPVVEDAGNDGNFSFSCNGKCLITYDNEVSKKWPNSWQDAYCDRVFKVWDIKTGNMIYNNNRKNSKKKGVIDVVRTIEAKYPLLKGAWKGPFLIDGTQKTGTFVFSPAGTAVMAFAYDPYDPASLGEFRIWSFNAETKKSENLTALGGKAFISKCVFSPDGTLLAVMGCEGWRGVVEVWNIYTGEKWVVKREESGFYIRDIAFLPDGQHLVFTIQHHGAGTGESCGSIEIVNLQRIYSGEKREISYSGYMPVKVGEVYFPVSVGMGKDYYYLSNGTAAHLIPVQLVGESPDGYWSTTV